MWTRSAEERSCRSSPTERESDTLSWRGPMTSQRDGAVRYLHINQHWSLRGQVTHDCQISSTVGLLSRTSKPPYTCQLAIDSSLCDSAAAASSPAASTRPESQTLLCQALASTVSILVSSWECLSGSPCCPRTPFFPQPPPELSGMSAPVATVASPQQPSSDTSAAAFAETTVTFEGPEGFPLIGILCEPTPQSAAAAAAGVHSSSGRSSSRRLFSPNQCAILCHGFASHKNGFHFPAIAHHLATELCMSSLRFDYTGNMDSPGPFRFASFMQEVEQMALAKQYLEQQHGKQVILLLGHSRGAINATLYSGRDSISMPPSQQQQQQPHPEPPSQQQQQQQQQSLATPWSHIIPIVVLVAGRYDLTLNMHQRYGSDVLQQLRQSGPSPQRTRRDKDGHEIHWELDDKGMAERFSTDIAGACERISALPEAVRPKVLVMHGVTDPICEALDATNLAQHIKGSTLLEVEGADHWYKGKRQQLLDAVTEFVQQAGREKGLC